MNLWTAFARSVDEQPAKTALFWGDRQFTYSELHLRAADVGERLVRDYGIKPGDRVGIWMKNCPEFIWALFAVFHAGGVAVPINNFLKPAELNHIVNDAGIDLILADSELVTFQETLAAAHPQLRMVDLSGTDGALAGDGVGAEPAHQAAAADLAVLIYTSGTTGRPKGAMLSHGNLLHNVESCRIVLQTIKDDRLAVMLPVFHSYMLTVGLLLPLIVGGSIVLVKSLHPVRNALQEMIQAQATILPAIPQFYRSLASHGQVMHFPFRLCVSGAAPLPGQVLKDFEEKFKIPLIEGYGLSEASPVVTKNPLNGTRKPGSIGLPIPHVEVSIQDDQGATLAAGETGEICVRGGNVMQGYWNQPEETAKVMRGDWLLTGDIGHRDEEGYFYVTDRKKDMLLVNGINVYPRQIEEVIYQFPGVKEVAVVGKPDERRGEQPVAFVAPQDGFVLDSKSIQAFVRKELADYKVPKHVVIMGALPRNATGKILKTSLREEMSKLLQANS
jgi:long-chain acyl-CoA synthetase